LFFCQQQALDQKAVNYGADPLPALGELVTKNAKAAAIRVQEGISARVAATAASAAAAVAAAATTAAGAGAATGGGGGGAFDAVVDCSTCGAAAAAARAAAPCGAAAAAARAAALLPRPGAAHAGAAAATPPPAVLLAPVPAGKPRDSAPALWTPRELALIRDIVGGFYQNRKRQISSAQLYHRGAVN
jgi:hypothetical protein